MAARDPQGVKSWWGEWGCRTTCPAAPISPTKTLAPANPSMTRLQSPLCLSLPFHIAGLCPASLQPALVSQLWTPAGWLTGGGDLGPAGEPRRTASPLCPWGLAGPAEPVQECRAGRVWHLGTGGPCGGGSRGGSSPRQWDGVSGAGQRVQPHWDDTMELPRVLLALAGTGAAAGLGDSPGGTGGLGGAVRCFPRGSFKCVCAREGVMRPGMAGRSPHQCCPPGAGTAGTP